MKSSNLLILITLAFFVVITPAFAQTGFGRVTVPFDFTVGTQLLAAGDYRVTINGVQLKLRRTDGSAVATVHTVNTGGGPDQDVSARLVFNRYGDRHFLSQVWLGETNMGHQLFASAAEVEAARSTRQSGTVTVAMGRQHK